MTSPSRSVVLVGMTWLDDSPGGLNRYLGSLHAALPSVGVLSKVAVAGARRDSDAAKGVLRANGNLPRRLLGIDRVVQQSGHDAEVLHSHFALHALLPALRGRLPLVTSFQGPWAQESKTEGDASAVRFAARSAVERAVYRRSQVLVCLSQAFADVLVDEYGVAPWRVKIVPPGVDLDHFRPRDRADARDRLELPAGFLALTVRRLAERMGLDVLLSSWAKRPDGLLLVAGSGPANQALHSQAKALGLGADRVRFLGRVDDSELPLYYSAADVSVVPTVALEGFGLVVLESLASGTPVIASATGGLAEILPRLQPDLLVEPGDAFALADRLSGAATGRQPLPTSEACRLFAEEFKWPNVAATFRDVYDEVVGARALARVSVVYLLSTGQPSGGELALLRTIQALGPAIVPHVVLAEHGPVCELLQDSGVTWEVLPLGSAGAARRSEGARAALKHGFAYAAYAARVAQRLRALSPDLVHANSLKAGVYGGFAARLVGVPMVWHVRDRLTEDYLPRHAARGFRQAVRFLPAGVVANSSVTMRTLRLRANQSSEVVPSPVDVPTWFRHAPDPTLRVVSVGRLSPWKGQDVLLRAFAQAFPSGEARLDIVGGALFGEDDYVVELHELADRLGVRDTVHFLGHRRNVWETLTPASVLVHCSVIPEPYGNVVAEGLAAGLAVIASDAGGPRELIQHGETGLLTPPGDVLALAEALRRLADNPALRTKLGAAAARSVGRLTSPVSARLLTSLYERVLGRDLSVVSAGA